MLHQKMKYGLVAIQEDAPASSAQQRSSVRERYDKLAPFIALIDHLLMMSLFRVRARAIAALPLKAGDTVVELGCGTGRNFSYLRNAVHRAGRIIGVEFSPGMFARARKLVADEKLQVELIDQDIARYAVPATDLVLLSLCYHTLEYPAQTLARVWESLKPGACLAIIDGKPPDFADAFFRSFGSKILEAVFMGDAQLKPWENLARLGSMQMKKYVGGAYYVCWAVKP